MFKSDFHPQYMPVGEAELVLVVVPEPVMTRPPGNPANGYFGETREKILHACQPASSGSGQQAQHLAAVPTSRRFHFSKFSREAGLSNP